VLICSQVRQRILWCFWLQGWHNAPDLVKACAATWRRHNPDWTIHYLSSENMGAFFDPDGEFQKLFEKDVPIEALSDVLRIELLSRFGGVWVDSTLYCLRPLDEWIHEVASSGFFAFDRPGQDRMLSSWFLAAEEDSYLVEVWRRDALAYWKNRDERDHYFWFHRLFEAAYASDRRFREIWDVVPKVSAKDPHYFLPYEKHLFRSVNDFDRLTVEAARVPVLKLSHKVPHVNGVNGTVYRWLCDRIMSGPSWDADAFGLSQPVSDP